MEMHIGFPGPGLQVSASFDGFEVRTDQPAEAGGQGTAPGPFDLFLASLGTCAGYYVLRFLRQRGLSTEGLALRLTTERDADTRMLSRVRLHVSLPPGFPPKYRRAILGAVDACSVKKHLHHPPVFTTSVEVDGARVATSEA